MNLIHIYDTNGQQFDLGALGLMGLRLRIPSPSYRTTTQEIDGHGGVIITDRVLESRKLTASFVSQAKNYVDSLELRDRLYSLFGSGKALYVSESEQPNKRWKVYLDEWTPDRFDVKTHIFEIPLLAVAGTSESITVIKKNFTTPTLRFKNEGSVLIDPRVHSETEIEITGASAGLAIQNNTTGDRWEWSGITAAGDKILLQGIKSLKNGVSIFGQTNKKLLTFAPGWNDLEVFGITEGAFNLTVKTRFYFL